MRQLVTLLAILFASVSLLLAQDRTIRMVVPFDGSSLNVNSTNYSSTIELSGYQPFSFNYAIQLQATNLTTATAGVVNVSYELSNDGATFSSNTTIAAGFSYTNSTSGAGFYQFNTGISRFIRFKAIVTPVTNCYFKALLAIQ